MIIFNNECAMEESEIATILIASPDSKYARVDGCNDHPFRVALKSGLQLELSLQDFKELANLKPELAALLIGYEQKLSTQPDWQQSFDEVREGAANE